MDFRKGALLYKCKHPFCYLAAMKWAAFLHPEKFAHDVLFHHRSRTILPSEQDLSPLRSWAKNLSSFSFIAWRCFVSVTDRVVNCASLKHLDLRTKLHQAVLGTNLLLVFLEFPVSLHHRVPSTHPLFHELPPCYVETWLSHFYSLEEWFVQ